MLHRAFSGEVSLVDEVIGTIGKYDSHSKWKNALVVKLAIPRYDKISMGEKTHILRRNMRSIH